LKFDLNIDRLNKIFFIVLFFCAYTVVPAQQQICYGSSMRYSVDSNDNLGKGSLGSTYYWQVKETNFKGYISNYLSDRTNEILINWGTTPPGEYHLIVNEISDSGCKGLSQILKVDILALPQSNLSKQFVCINPLTKDLISPAILDTKLSASEYRFDWQFNGFSKGNTPSIEVFDVGSYSVQIQDLTTQCKATYKVDVGLSSTSSSKIKVDNFFQDNQSIIISVINGIGDYEFSIDGINFQESPSFNVTKGGFYTVIIRDKKGCSDEALQAHIVTYPKFFTPNNDGYNDIWKIEGLTAEMNPVISIFDRYGKLLKVIHIQDIGWNGVFNGVDLPSDDYWFSIEYFSIEGVPSVFKSHFSLIR
jgi:gliding motility-associated-like protein